MTGWVRGSRALSPYRALSEQQPTGTMAVMTELHGEGGFVFGSQGLSFTAEGLVVGGNPAQPPVKTTGIALTKVQSFVINQYEPIEGGTPFELAINGESVLFGIGEITDALVDMAIYLEEGRPDVGHD